ncbi:58_t:CDS:10, partial [Ambispora leptoticha]
MLVSRTTNRKVYRIVNVTDNYNSLRVHLDDYVSYSDGSYKHIDIAGYYRYNNYYYQGRYVEIDNSKTRYEGSGHEFNDSSVVKITDINAALIYQAREEFANMQNQNTNLQNQNTNLQNLITLGKNELEERNRQITTKDEQIGKLTDQIKEDRVEYKLSKEKYEELRDLFTTLQIQNNDKDQEIEKKEGEVRELKEERENSKEKTLDHEIKKKDTKLEERIKKLGVDRKKIRELGRLYRQLVRIREDNYNQDKIDEINDKIIEIKDEILDEGKISTDDVQKLFEKCEELAKLKIEHEKTMEEKKYNRFTGSLKPLKSLTKLKSLYIEETDIDGGLEYLSDTVETILCSFQSLNREKQELQQDIFSLQGKFRLDGKEVERLNKRNKELEEENSILYKKLEKLQLEGAKIDEKVRIKKNELERIKSKLETKLENEFQASFLENLLIFQEQIIRLEGGNQQIINLSQKQFDKVKEKLTEKLSEEEINEVCQVQGINPGATQEEIRKAYLEKSKQYHPDRPGGSKEKFQEINEAYEKLEIDEVKGKSSAFGEEWIDKNNKSHTIWMESAILLVEFRLSLYGMTNQDVLDGNSTTNENEEGKEKEVEEVIKGKLIDQNQNSETTDKDQQTSSTNQPSNEKTSEKTTTEDNIQAEQTKKNNEYSENLNQAEKPGATLEEKAEAIKKSGLMVGEETPEQQSRREKINESIGKLGAEKLIKSLKKEVENLANASQKKIKELKEKLNKIIHSKNKYDQEYKQQAQSLLAQLESKQVQNPSDNNHHSCQEDGCRTIISYGSYCSQHDSKPTVLLINKVAIMAVIVARKDQLNTANNQLTAKRQEVIWLQEQLKILIGEEEYQAQIEIEGTGKLLEGELILTNFPNLKVNVCNNKITELEISSLEHLEYLNCGNNELNELEKLVKLKWVNGNNFARQINEVYENKIEGLKNFISYLQIMVNDKNHELEKKERKVRELKELLDGGIDVVDAQKLCHKCESIAKLRAEQDKLYKERFEAKQEVV